MMKRRQVFLFHEQSWLPAMVRNSIRDYLSFNEAMAKNAGLQEEDEPISRSGFYNKDSFLAQHPESVPAVVTVLSTSNLSPLQLNRVLANAAINREDIRILDLKQSGSIVLPEILLTSLKTMVYASAPATFNIRSFFFTFLIPVVPLAATWDIWSSHLRKYSAAELLDLTQRIAVTGYSFRIGQLESVNGRQSYIVTGSYDERKAA